MSDGIYTINSDLYKATRLIPLMTNDVQMTVLDPFFASFWLLAIWRIRHRLRSDFSRDCIHRRQGVLVDSEPETLCFHDKDIQIVSSFVLRQCPLRSIPYSR